MMNKKDVKLHNFKGLFTPRESESESETFLSIFVTTLKILKAQFKVTFQDRFVSVWISNKGAIALPESQTDVKTILSHNYIADGKYWFVIQSVMGDRPIQPIIQAVTIDIMLNNNGLNIGEGLNYVKCEQTWKETRLRELSSLEMV